MIGGFVRVEAESIENVVQLQDRHGVLVKNLLDDQGAGPMLEKGLERFDLTEHPETRAVVEDPNSKGFRDQVGIFAQPNGKMNLVRRIATLVELERGASAIAWTLKGTVHKEAVGQPLESLAI
jgi:hypothetical protein